MVEQTRGGGCCEDVISYWQSLEQLRLSREAMDSLEINGQINLPGIHYLYAWMAIISQCKIFIVFCLNRVRGSIECSWF